MNPELCYRVRDIVAVTQSPVYEALRQRAIEKWNGQMPIHLAGNGELPLIAGRQAGKDRRRRARPFGAAQML